MQHSKESFFNDVFLTLKNYILQSVNSELLVKVKKPTELGEEIPQLQKHGVSDAQLVQELTEILDQSVNTTHPLFLNQLFGGLDPAAWAGEITSTLLNPTMATYEIAPALTIIEKRLVAELLKIINIPEGEGIMVTGGSNSNLLAMLCARTHFNPSIRQSGFAHNRCRVYVSAEAHYSFDKAANITGIGTQNLILVPCNQRGEMIPEELEKIITADLRDGFTPIMVGATIGTTVLGAFDPLEAITVICKAHKIWLHVDAAWGGGALFSTDHKSKTKGIAAADSVTFDAHKTLGTSLIASFFLTSHAGILKNANRGGGSEYLFHEYDNSEWDTGTYSLQCGRRADALKLWFLWRSHGTDGIIKRTDHLFELASFATEEISRNPKFRLIHSNYLNVCFQVVPQRGDENVNAFTLRVRNTLVSGGKALVNYAQRSDGTIFFRLVFPNHQTQKAHVSKLLRLIEETAGLIETVEL
ncbi:MAG TPA: aminotransferase class V-fold PLP-dependent enzyme [Bacteriovoracaceae bacterium]|nr:aminotransferase class V-fold PLP-dependent enzyme [Bacteriovoracaceae bacterium]